MRKMTAAIDPSLLAPIGSVTVNFAMLEQTLAFGVWLLLFGNNSLEQRAGQIVTAELSFRRTVELFSCLFRHRFPGAPDDSLRRLSSRLLGAEAKRNTVVHSHWGAAGEPGYSTRIKTTGKAKGISFTFEKTSAADLMTLADDIAVLAYDLQAFQLGLLS